MINDVEQFVICWFYIWIFSFVKSFSIFLLGCVPCIYQFVEVLYILDTIHSSEKAMAPHSSTLACKIPWMEEPGRLQSMGSRRVRHDWELHFHFSLSCIGEGNGNPFQCSRPENPRDGAAWWTVMYGVTQSRTQSKRLSSSSSNSHS